MLGGKTSPRGSLCSSGQQPTAQVVHYQPNRAEHIQYRPYCMQSVVCGHSSMPQRPPTADWAQQRQRVLCEACVGQTTSHSSWQLTNNSQHAAMHNSASGQLGASSTNRHRRGSSSRLSVVALNKEEVFGQPQQAAAIVLGVQDHLESTSSIAGNKANNSVVAAATEEPSTSATSSSSGGSNDCGSNDCGSRDDVRISSNAETSCSSSHSSSGPSATAAVSDAAMAQDLVPPSGLQALYPPSERSQIQESWDMLMRWSKAFSRRQHNAVSPIEAAQKVVVFGGGSFGTAMGTALALKKSSLDVVLLLRDLGLCQHINEQQCNTKYLPGFQLPSNVRATTNAAEAIAGAAYAVHAVPVQHSRTFLSSIKDVLPKDVPIVCVSKGLEVGTGCMMSEVISSALGRRQPAVFLSGPSFAKEVMQGRPTGVVAACKDAALAREVQELFASPCMRVNTSTDVTGVEICGALKNVLAIAAGIVEGLELGHNALAALIAQGCAEIRWLSQKVGAKPATISGLSGLGDIMLTCYGDLSRNRSVGVRLGRGEKLHIILASSSQVAEGVATAGVVVGLARKYRVSLPVLTAVAQVLDNNLTPAEAVAEIMSLPQIEEH